MTTFASTFLVGAAAAVMLGAGMGAGVVVAVGTHQAAVAAEPACSLPRGLAFEALGARDRGFVVRRQLLCDDVEHGRIAIETYRARIAALDATWATPPIAPPIAPAMQWASSVIAVSSEYSPAGWSAQHALGPPDVYPASGDDARAWAPAGADDRDAWIEVGYAQPTTIDGVELYETYNPGAVDRVELTTISGRKQVVYAIKAPGTPSAKHRIDFACTAEPIASVRVHLDSPAVTGWNELDAIGVQPCAP